MTRPRRVTVAAMMALAALSAAPAWATSRAMSVAELSGGAELIVQGRIARVESRWNGDRSAIHSDVAVAVGRTLKGALPASSKGREVVFRVLGGEVDGTRMVSSSDAMPAVGEEMVLFLRSEAAAGSASSRSAAAATGSGPLTLVGQESGAYSVRAGRVETHDGRKVGLDEFLADVARAAK